MYYKEVQMARNSSSGSDFGVHYKQESTIMKFYGISYLQGKGLQKTYWLESVLNDHGMLNTL